MTFEEYAGYQVTVIVTLPSDDSIDSFEATQMWMRSYAALKRDAARLHEIEGNDFLCGPLRHDANKIHEALRLQERTYDDRKRRRIL